MAEGIFLTKGKKKIFVRPSGIEAKLAEGWKPSSDVALDGSGSGASSQTPDEFVEAQRLRSPTTTDAPELMGQEEHRDLLDEKFKQEAFDTAGNEALAFGSGVASAATLGGSDYLLKKAGYGEDLKNITDVNPLARGGGEFVGAIGSAVASGGSSLARYAPGALATKLATGVGKGAFAKTGSKAARYAAEGMADAAAWTVAQNHADAIIADKPVNIEMLAADLPMAIAFGGVLGGSIGKLSSKLDADKIAKQATGDLLTPEGWAAANTRLQSNLLDAKKGVSDLKFSDPGYAKKLKKLKKQQAKAQKAVDSYQPKKPTEAATSNPVRGALDTINTTLADDIFEHADKIGARKQAKVVTDVIASGKYLEGTADDLNKLLADYKALGHKGTDFNLKKLEGVADGFPELEAMKVYEDGALSKFGQGLQDQKVDLGLVHDVGSANLVRAWGAHQPTVKEARALATSAADEAAALAKFDADNAALGGITKEVDALGPRADFHASAKAKATERATEAAYEAKKFRIENAKPKAPKEAAPPTGLVAQLSDATLGRMSRAIRGGQEKISAGIKGFIRVAGKPRRGTIPAASTILGRMKFDEDLGEKPKKGRKAEMQRVTKGLDELMANPDKVKQNLHKATRGGAMLKPAMNDAVLNKAMQRVMFLHGLVPRSPNLTALQKDRWQPTDTEIDKFTRIAAAAEDPYSILDDLNRGTITQEAVDTVKQLYPEIYHSIQMELVNSAEQIKENVGYKGRLQLGILFQAPTDVVLEPSFVKMMQENYAIRAQEQEQSGSNNQYSTPGNNQKAIASTATTSQRLEAK